MRLVETQIPGAPPTIAPGADTPASDRPATFSTSDDESFENTTLNETRPAAERGNAAAQRRMGYIYRFGNGTATDLVPAAHWYGLAADQGDAKARSQLADMLFSGTGIAKDQERVAHLSQRAAAQGDDRVMTRLACMYEQGQGWPGGET